MVYSYKEKDKIQVKTLVSEFQKRLNLHTWKFELRFHDKDKFDHKSSSWSCAEIWADPVYKKAQIDFYPKLLEQRDTVGVSVFRDMICHEMCHCLTEWLSNIAKCRFLVEWEIMDECENLTQKIAVIVLGEYENSIEISKEKSKTWTTKKRPGKS